MRSNPTPAIDVVEASLLGTLLVRILATTDRHVATALELQRRTRQNIGDALLELGAVSRAELQVALALQHRMRAGDVLGACGEVLDRAYDVAARSTESVRALAATSREAHGAH